MNDITDETPSMLSHEQSLVPPVQRQVGLALRADRRRREQSQRAYAAARSLSRDTLARAESDASGLKLRTVLALLQGTGFRLAVLPADADDLEPWWEPTDVEARTRAGQRFPAHREVAPSPGGPEWWWYHEVLGNRGLGPSPQWSAEGFRPPPGTQFGRSPTPDDEGRPRWPFPDPATIDLAQ